MATEITGLAQRILITDPWVPVTQMTLTCENELAGGGISSHNRQVSLISAETVIWMDAQAEQGLCFSRYRANIVISGFPTEAFIPGDCLRTGDVLLRISHVKKDCFSECNRFDKKMPCRLRKSAVFAAVEKGGTIRLRDPLCMESPISILKSKRNKVILRGETVEKYFENTDNIRIETAVLQKLLTAGVSVPDVLFIDEYTLKLSFIRGETLPDLLDRYERSSDFSELQGIADGIIMWLGSFYTAMSDEGIIRGDMNGRNFIWDGRRIWGLDFEECKHGERERDIGQLLAYILRYDPPETKTKSFFAEKLLDAAIVNLDIDIEKVYRYRDEELTAMMQRRRGESDYKPSQP